MGSTRSSISATTMKTVTLYSIGYGSTPRRRTYCAADIGRRHHACGRARAASIRAPPTVCNEAAAPGAGKTRYRLPLGQPAPGGFPPAPAELAAHRTPNPKASAVRRSHGRRNVQHGASQLINLGMKSPTAFHVRRETAGAVPPLHWIADYLVLKGVECSRAPDRSRRRARTSVESARPHRIGKRVYDRRASRPLAWEPITKKKNRTGFTGFLEPTAKTKMRDRQDLQD